ncbi:lysophospholipase L1-like esterase [Cylindrospermum stagnale PCC 7417]|uniref:Lysophospholipase L1-like esterase n=1 Tax=Cylindrospermum stagnale PCC 7417 TaxID=56107 RepID=K9WQ56_9NOST|nr:alpha/beta hydrolase [Cylindrospermum stagnale]AFZ22515.1 lysophospholipase L1-like esterase [Cylindrospermum stagnale PCC 7417]
MIKYPSRLLLSLSGCLIPLLLDSLFGSLPSLAAKTIVLRYGLLEQSLPVADLRRYAETQQVSSELQSFLSYLKPKEKQMFQGVLQVKKFLDIGAFSKLVNTQIGEQFLNVYSPTIARRDQAGIPALKSALVLGATSPEGLGIISFLEAYPSNRIVIDLAKTSKLLRMPKLPAGSTNPPPKDNLTASPLWQLELQYQTFATQDKKFSGCLFGDSISAGLGNSLGEGTFNFAFNGVSTISLVEQLQRLIPTNAKCQKTVIAIGGNDAWYGMSDELFVQKLQEAIALVRATGTKEIFLIPAFYSTVAASLDPNKAAPLSRVEKINALITQVAATEKVTVAAEGVAPLYENNVLKENLTSDGHHLNAEGLNIYRAALLKLLGS